MGTLDIKGSTPRLPRSIDDRKVTDLHKKLEKQLAAWPAATKQLEGVAKEILSTLTAMANAAQDKGREKKATPELKDDCQTLFDAAQKFGKHFLDMT